MRKPRGKEWHDNRTGTNIIGSGTTVTLPGSIAHFVVTGSVSVLTPAFSSYWYTYFRGLLFFTLVDVGDSSATRRWLPPTFAYSIWELSEWCIFSTFTTNNWKSFVGSSFKSETSPYKRWRGILPCFYCCQEVKAPSRRWDAQDFSFRWIGMNECSNDSHAQTSIIAATTLVVGGNRVVESIFARFVQPVAGLSASHILSIY